MPAGVGGEFILAHTQKIGAGLPANNCKPNATGGQKSGHFGAFRGNFPVEFVPLHPEKE